MTAAEDCSRELAILQHLVARTRAHTLTWDVGASRSDEPDAYVVDLGEFRVAIRELPDQDYPYRPDYQIVVTDSAGGEVIYSFTNLTLRPVSDTPVGDDLTVYAAMEQIYRLARRQALGVDQRLDRLVEILSAAS